MRVRVHRDGDVAVPEPLTDNLRMDTGGQQDRSVGMTQAMQGEVRESGLLYNSLEVLAEFIGYDRSSIGTREDVSAVRPGFAH